MPASKEAPLRLKKKDPIKMARLRNLHRSVSAGRSKMSDAMRSYSRTAKPTLKPKIHVNQTVVDQTPNFSAIGESVNDYELAPDYDKTISSSIVVSQDAFVPLRD
jgi:hypothetical protein